MPLTLLELCAHAASSRSGFFALADSNAHTNGAQQYNVDSMRGNEGPGYEIVLGGWGGSQSVIREHGQGASMVNRQTRGIVSDQEFKQFWASAANG